MEVILWHSVLVSSYLHRFLSSPLFLRHFSFIRHNTLISVLQILLVTANRSIFCLFRCENASDNIVTHLITLDKHLTAPLLTALLAFGTHYCDITGETDWVRDMIDKHDAAAKASGARIVHFCGHDCVPWDLAGNSRITV
jgi:hypothetical protein